MSCLAAGHDDENECYLYQGLLPEVGLHVFRYQWGRRPSIPESFTPEQVRSSISISRPERVFRRVRFRPHLI